MAENCDLTNDTRVTSGNGYYSPIKEMIKLERAMPNSFSQNRSFEEFLTAAGQPVVDFEKTNMKAPKNTICVEKYSITYGQCVGVNKERKKGFSVTPSQPPVNQISNLSINNKNSDNRFPNVTGQCNGVNAEKKKGLTTIIENLKYHRNKLGDVPDVASETLGSTFNLFGETSATEVLENSSPPSAVKPSRKRRQDRVNINNNGPTVAPISVADYSMHNNNNHVKNERLSPGTPDTSSRSRSVTPSPASHPATPPALENPMLPIGGRNYSDFMRSLAAKYNNANPNEYFSAVRNGFPPPLDPRFKPTFPNLLPSLQQNSTPKEDLNKKPDLASVLSSYTNSTMFQPLIDMSTTQTLLAMVRTAKEVELQSLFKKRQDSSSPLDLSPAAPPIKRLRVNPSSIGGRSGPNSIKRAESASPQLHEDVSNWSVDDVCNFIAGIDICAEYVQNFREQRIDGAGLPLLTEEHLTSTMNMKLGPALKLRSILAKKLGSCGICLHCAHCHVGARSPEVTNNTGNSSDSGGGTS